MSKLVYINSKTAKRLINLGYDSGFEWLYTIRIERSGNF